MNFETKNLLHMYFISTLLFACSVSNRATPSKDSGASNGEGQIRGIDRKNKSMVSTRYIVTLKEPSLLEKHFSSIPLNSNRVLTSSTQSVTSQEIQAYKQELIASTPLIKQGLEENVGHSLEVVDRLTGSVNALVLDHLSTDDIARIKQHSDVLRVDLDEIATPMMLETLKTVGAVKASLSIDRDGRPLKGDGVTIAVIDSGIDYTHPDFGSCSTPGENCRVIGGKNVMDYFANYNTSGEGQVVSNHSFLMDEQSHGTSVASVIAGNGVVKGIAPHAKLLAVKVMNGKPWSYVSWIIKGIDFVIDPNGDGDYSDHVDIANISLGTNRGCERATDQSLPEVNAIKRASQAGVTVVVAAGNDARPGSISTLGCAESSIVVGSSHIENDIQKVDEWSAKGLGFDFGFTKPDLVAHGDQICAAMSKQSDDLGFPRMDGTKDTTCVDTFHGKGFGTSLSAGVVSGALALLIQKGVPVENLKATLLRDYIKRLPENEYDRNISGAGALDLSSLESQASPKMARIQIVNGDNGEKHFSQLYLQGFKVEIDATSNLFVTLQSGLGHNPQVWSTDLETQIQSGQGVKSRFLKMVDVNRVREHEVLTYRLLTCESRDVSTGRNSDCSEMDRAIYVKDQFGPLFVTDSSLVASGELKFSVINDQVCIPFSKTLDNPRDFQNRSKLKKIRVFHQSLNMAWWNGLLANHDGFPVINQTPSWMESPTTFEFNETTFETNLCFESLSSFRSQRENELFDINYIYTFIKLISEFDDGHLAAEEFGPYSSSRFN